MDNAKWMDQMVGFMKSSFETTMSAMGTIQDQSEKIINTILDQGMMAQQEGRKVLNEWIGMANKGRHDYHKMVVDNLHKATDFVTAPARGK